MPNNSLIIVSDGYLRDGTQAWFTCRKGFTRLGFYLIECKKGVWTPEQNQMCGNNNSVKIKL